MESAIPIQAAHMFTTWKSVQKLIVAQMRRVEKTKNYKYPENLDLKTSQNQAAMGMVIQQPSIS
jgi:hypothetical protein